MEYDWEEGVAKKLAQIDAILPHGISLVGVAVGDFENGEGALVEVSDACDSGDVTKADIRQDIMGDAQAQYGRTSAQVFGERK